MGNVYLTKRRRRMLRFLLVLGSVCVAVVMTEIGLRIAGVSYPILQTYDEHRGFALRPGAAGWCRREGEAFVQINSDGLRDREHQKEKPAGTLRIAVLGDSFAEARSVSMDDAFWAVLERELAQCSTLAGMDIEVINFGVSEYGTAQELLTLRHHVWDYDPDIVLLAFFSGNDISDNSEVLGRRAYRPFFKYVQGALVPDESFRRSKPYRLLSSWYGQLLMSLSDYSRVVQVARERYVRRFQRKSRAGAAKGRARGERGLDTAYIFTEPDNPDWQQAWSVTEDLIALMADEVRDHGAEFLLVTLTCGIQVQPDPKTREQAARDLGITDLFYPERRIEALGKRAGFDVLQLAPPLQEYAEREQVFLHGFENTELGTGHWNEAGHRLAGQLMAGYLCGEG